MSQPVLLNLVLSNLTPVAEEAAGEGVQPGGGEFGQALRLFLQGQDGAAAQGWLQGGVVKPGELAKLTKTLGALDDRLPANVSAEDVFKAMADALTHARWQAEGAEPGAEEATEEELMAELLLDNQTANVDEEGGDGLDLVDLAAVEVEQDVPAEAKGQGDEPLKESEAAPGVYVPSPVEEVAEQVVEEVEEHSGVSEVTTQAASHAAPAQRHGEAHAALKEPAPRPAAAAEAAAASAPAVTTAKADDKPAVDGETMADLAKDLPEERRAEVGAEKDGAAQQPAGPRNTAFRDLALQMQASMDGDAPDRMAPGQVEGARGIPNLTQGTNGPGFQTLLLNTPIHKDSWGEAFGSRITWMIKNEMQGAELRLNPPHLGRIDIRIDIQDDQASISFNTQNSSVREAVEASLPRLREMLADSGLNLANTNVSQQGGDGRHPQGQGQGQGDERLSGPVMPEFGETTDTDQPGSGKVFTSKGMVDFFA